jgi:hypothetical protein
MFYVLKLEHEEQGEESTQKDQTRMFFYLEHNYYLYDFQN